MGTIAVVCTMDTKGREADYVRERIEARGHRALLLDVSTKGRAHGTPDISSSIILRKADVELSSLQDAATRERAVSAMCAGAATVLAEQYAAGAISGAIGIGGNQGSAIAAAAMRALPLGVPKYLISTVASQNMRPFVGHKDIAVQFSISDFVGGPNFVSKTVLANAVAAVIGMVESGEPLMPQPARQTVALTALGNTEAAANRAIERLQAEGFEVVTFHASGAGGSAMEELIAAGRIDAVLDLTLHELTEEVLDVGIYVPVTAGRLTVSLAHKIPTVAAPGGMEYLCFGPRVSIPEAMQDRTICMHNSNNANLKIDREELIRVATELADRLNRADGPVALFVPRRGFSIYGGEGGPFHDPEGIEAFVRTLKERLKPHVSLEVSDANINDPEFVDACVTQLLEFLSQQGSAARR